MMVKAGQKRRTLPRLRCVVTCEQTRFGTESDSLDLLDDGSWSDHLASAIGF
jgi:hypothetical protein